MDNDVLTLNSCLQSVTQAVKDLENAYETGASVSCVEHEMEGVRVELEGLLDVIEAEEIDLPAEIYRALLFFDDAVVEVTHPSVVETEDERLRAECLHRRFRDNLVKVEQELDLVTRRSVMSSLLQDRQQDLASRISHTESVLAYSLAHRIMTNDLSVYWDSPRVRFLRVGSFCAFTMGLGSLATFLGTGSWDLVLVVNCVVALVGFLAMEWWRAGRRFLDVDIRSKTSLDVSSLSLADFEREFESRFGLTVIPPVESLQKVKNRLAAHKLLVQHRQTASD